MKDKLNIVIVGGGSTWCPGILKALTKHMDILPLNRVMLYDIDAERQRPIGEFGKILFAEEEPGVEFGYTTDKDEAYTDVDFVLCQIRTGGYEMRSKDEKIPLHMGIIGQETVGPGGMASFGHAAYFGLGAYGAALAVKWLGLPMLPALAFALLVGLSRVYLGVHYPSDILAGWAAAIAWAVLAYLLVFPHGQRPWKQATG